MVRRRRLRERLRRERLGTTTSRTVYGVTNPWGALLPKVKAWFPTRPRSGCHKWTRQSRPEEDLTAPGRRTGSAWDPSHAAVYNGVFVNHRFRGGESVKIARVTPYVPGAR